MKTFRYTDSNGRTQYGTIYDNTSKVDCSNINLHGHASKPICVLGHHIKLDMILAFILWLVITIAFGAEINLIAWMIGGFVYHIVKNIIKLKKNGYLNMGEESWWR